MTWTPPPSWAPPARPPRTSSRHGGVATAALALVSLWAGLLVLAGIPYVFYDSLAGRTSPDVSLAGFVALVFGLNVWLGALVLSVIAAARRGPRRVLRALLVAALLVCALVGAFVAYGVTTGEDDSTLTHVMTRGLVLWGIAALVVLGTRQLLRTAPAARTASTAQRWVLAGALLTLVAGVVAAAHITGLPGVYIHNDGDEAVTVQVCPVQRCTGGAVQVAPGQTRHFRLGKGDREIPDSARVTQRGAVLGCLLIDREPDEPNNLEYSVSDADLETC